MDTIFQILKPSLEKPDISIADTENPTVKDEISAGGKSPLILMGGTYFKGANIKSFSLEYGETLFPILSFVVHDKNDIISNNLIDTVDTVDVFVRSDNVDFEPIGVKFLITDHQKSQGDTFSFTCEMFVGQIEHRITKDYTGTSWDVLKNVCKEHGLGFSSNIQSTNDEQTWLRISQNFSGFISEITRSSWYDEKSGIKVWIDPYYNLNVFDITSSKAVDKGDFDKITETNLSEEYLKEKKPVISDMYLTNSVSKTGTYNFIEFYKPVDKTGDIEKDFGFERNIKTQDLESNEYFEYNIQHEISNKRVSRDPINSRSSYIGFTTDNRHRNYSHAIIQNGVNIAIHESKGLKVGLKGINPLIYVGMNVPIVLTAPNAPNKDMGGDETIMNEKLTGNYIITSIEYKYKKQTMSTGVMTMFDKF